MSKLKLKLILFSCLISWNAWAQSAVSAATASSNLTADFQALTKNLKDCTEHVEDVRNAVMKTFNVPQKLTDINSYISTGACDQAVGVVDNIESNLLSGWGPSYEYRIEHYFLPYCLPVETTTFDDFKQQLANIRSACTTPEQAKAAAILMAKNSDPTKVPGSSTNAPPAQPASPGLANR